MAMSTEYHPDLGIVEVKFTGQLSEDEQRTATFEAYELGKEYNTILFIVNSLEVEKVQFIDIYYLPRLYNELGFDRHSRIAQILPRNKEAIEFAEFYEDVLSNRGWQIKSFADREEAIIWLTNKDQSNQ